MLAPDVARQWVARWDRQQERYVADREERFTVIADVVAASAGRPDPTIVDLGAGPGSLSARLLERLPAARVTAVDGDPLLLALARGAYDLHTVECDVRDAGWDATLPPADAVVSTTALHWLTGPELGRVYNACARLLRPGGVLIDGDHFDEGAGQASLDALAQRVQDARAERVGVLTNEEWAAWWDAVGEAPELHELVGERGPRPIEHTVPDVPSLRDHERLLRAAGFAEVGTVWQCGRDRVVVAVR